MYKNILKTIFKLKYITQNFFENTKNEQKLTKTN